MSSTFPENIDLATHESCARVKLSSVSNDGQKGTIENTFQNTIGQQSGMVNRSNGRRRFSYRKMSTDILQEIQKMSLASQDLLERQRKKQEENEQGAVSSLFRRKLEYNPNKRKQPEELFTDKDRAAVVTMGFKDIKQSLRLKKQEDKKKKLAVSFARGEDFVLGSLLREAKHQLLVKQPQSALIPLNKALEIRDTFKEALVMRSLCFLQLGDAESALHDAERSLDASKDEYLPGLYQHAEVLYQLGEFEMALITFHRGHKICPNQGKFLVGIRKCEEAIGNAIGSPSATEIPNMDEVLSLVEELENVKRRMSPEDRRFKRDEDVLNDIVRYKEEFCVSSPRDAKLKLVTNEVLGRLSLDKAYIQRFIKRLEVSSIGKAAVLCDESGELLRYIESREEFWRQQRPIYSRAVFATILSAKYLEK